MNIVEKWKSWAPQFLSILRIVSAAMFITFGVMKLWGYPIGMPPDNSTAKLWTEVWFGGVLEVFGGALLLIGLCTRPIAFVLSGEMAVAYWQFHAPASMWPVINQGPAAVLYCFVFLYLSAAGPGPWSVDAMRGKR